MEQKGELVLDFGWTEVLRVDLDEHLARLLVVALLFLAGSPPPA